MTVIDRFEGEKAVLETEKGMVTVLRSSLPAGAAEGDVIVLRNGSYLTDKKATAERRRQIRSKLRRLIKEER